MVGPIWYSACSSVLLKCGRWTGLLTLRHISSASGLISLSAVSFHSVFRRKNLVQTQASPPALEGEGVEGAVRGGSDRLTATRQSP